MICLSGPIPAGAVRFPAGLTIGYEGPIISKIILYFSLGNSIELKKYDSYNRSIRAEFVFTNAPMIQAKDIMTTRVITVNPQTPIAKAARILLKDRINGLPVLDDQGRLVGIICQHDLVVQQKGLPIPSLFRIMDLDKEDVRDGVYEKDVEKIIAATVGEAMTKDPVFVRPDTSLEVLAELMVDHSFHTLPVLENGRLVGVVGKEDVLRTLTDK